jgi:hypothetical protein
MQSQMANDEARILEVRLFPVKVPGGAVVSQFEFSLLGIADGKAVGSKVFGASL